MWVRRQSGEFLKQLLRGWSWKWTAIVTRELFKIPHLTMSFLRLFWAHITTKMIWRFAIYFPDAPHFMVSTRNHWALETVPPEEEECFPLHLLLQLKGKVQLFTRQSFWFFACFAKWYISNYKKIFHSHLRRLGIIEHCRQNSSATSRASTPSSSSSSSSSSS